MALTMLIVSLLMAAIFVIVGSTSQLADGMQRDQDRDSQRHSFAQFCERTLRSMPANAKIRLKVKQSGNHYLSELALKNAPAAFSGAGANGVTILETEEQTDGYMRLVLKYLNAEEASAAESGRFDADKQQRLVLLENVAKCEWRFFDSRSQEWVTVWNEKMSLGDPGMREFPYPAEFDPPQIPKNPINPTTGQPPQATPQGSPAVPVAPSTSGLRPGLIELTLSVAGDTEQRFVFWMPPAQLPQVSAGAPPVVPGTNPDGTPLNPQQPPSGSINVNAPPVPTPAK
jgi:hypothetical protein